MIDRRQMLVAGALAAVAGPRPVEARPGRTNPDVAASGSDQTSVFQGVIDASASSDPVILPPGDYRVGKLEMKSGTRLIGTPGKTRFVFTAPDAGLSIHDAETVAISGIVLDGKGAAGSGQDGALISAENVKALVIRDCLALGSAGNGIMLRKVSGRVTDCDISDCRFGGLFSQDAAGLEIAYNHVHDCGDNGIQVWRSEIGEDGTLISGNRVERIRSESGGSGQHGNGVSLFRAGAVLVTGNRISDCAYTAIRGNSAWNYQAIGNSCSRLGEVAIYSEFAYEGALIANNLIDGASMGVSVTNFNNGGRLAVVQGNLVRNLTGKMGTGPGVGIAVEADCMVTGNVIENAPVMGIAIGWYWGLRDVNVTSNLIRDVGIGIGVSADPRAGYAFVTNNMITGAKNGAIRAMDGDKALGKDLVQSSAEAYRNMAIAANVGLPASQPSSDKPRQR